MWESVSWARRCVSEAENSASIAANRPAGLALGGRESVAIGGAGSGIAGTTRLRRECPESVECFERGHGIEIERPEFFDRGMRNELSEQ